MKIEDKKGNNSVESQTVDKSRRSFSKKGVIAPVIMTLANRSAWGGEFCVANQSATGILSFAAGLNSLTTVTPITDWKTPQEWNIIFAAATLPPGYSLPTGVDYSTAQTILNTWNGSDPQRLAAYQMASQLNAVNYGGFPSLFTDGIASLEQYQIFYNNCT